MTTPRDCARLLRHFSISEGLVRGTSLVSYVVFTAAFALLPGFGPQGLLFSNAIQFTFQGLLETPFGWLADRFGWAKAVIVSFFLKLLVTLLIFTAVFCAYHNEAELAWLFISLEAIVDAFAISLYDGAFQASYTRWYESKLKEIGRTVSDSPPLFIASTRFSIWFRFGIPLTVIALVIVAQLIPWGVPEFSAYSATFFAFSIILLLRALVCFRVVADLREVVREEATEVEIRRTINLKRVIPAVMRAASNNFPSFLMYSISRAQYVLSCFCIAGFSMQQMNKLSLPQPYGWLASISLTLTIFILDNLFWRLFGHRIEKSNATRWIRSLGFTLLISCLMASVMYSVNAHYLIQAAAFALCALAGVICSSAIERFLTSYLHEWVDKNVVASCLSISEGLGMIACGIVLAAVITIDRFVPSTSVLLAISVLVALSIIYYVSAGVLFFRQKSLSLRSFLGQVFLTVATLGGAIIAVVDTHSFVTNAVARHSQAEQHWVDQVARIAERGLAHNEMSPILFELEHFLERAGLSCISLDGVTDLGDCVKNQRSLASMEYSRTIGAGHRRLTLYFDRTPLLVSIAGRVCLTALLFLAAVALLYLALICVTRRLLSELTSVLRSSGESDHARESQFAITEFCDLSRKLRTVAELTKENTAHRLAADVAARVAHDIRSPLAALSVLVGQVRNIDEGSRTTMRKSLARISEIANEMLVTEKALRSRDITIPKQTSDAATPLLLSLVIDEIMTEKRVRYRDRTEIRFETDFQASSYAAFAEVEPALLKAVLSNLIDNAVEAIPGAGLVQVSLSSSSESVLLLVRDTGKGIPPHILSELGKAKLSHAKPSGNGIGLFNAKRTIDRWGGEMELYSRLGVGTKILVRLPIVGAPAWFISELEVTPGQNICIVDDEDSIHDLWRRRFEFLTHSDPSLRLFHFRKGSELLKWRKEHKRAKAIFLVDYELGSFTTGLDLIEDLECPESSYIVSSHFDDKKLLGRCVARGVRLIPKTLAVTLPIRLRGERTDRFVLIDDDALVRSTWSISAEKAGVDFSAFENMQSFLAESSKFDSSARIYIDLNLGTQDGLELARNLVDMGYSEVHIATGAPADAVTCPAGVKSVIGKCPPDWLTLRATSGGPVNNSIY